jgi:hypothetical protein
MDHHVGQDDFRQTSDVVSISVFIRSRYRNPARHGPMGAGYFPAKGAPHELHHADELRNVSLSVGVSAHGHADVHVHHARIVQFLADIHIGRYSQQSRDFVPRFHFSRHFHKGSHRHSRATYIYDCLPRGEAADRNDTAVLGLAHVERAAGRLGNVVFHRMDGGRRGLPL